MASGSHSTATPSSIGAMRISWLKVELSAYSVATRQCPMPQATWLSAARK